MISLAAFLPFMLHRHFKLEIKLLRFQNTAAGILTLEIRGQNGKQNIASPIRYLISLNFFLYIFSVIIKILFTYKDVFVLATAAYNSVI